MTIEGFMSKLNSMDFTPGGLGYEEEAFVGRRNPKTGKFEHLAKADVLLKELSPFGWKAEFSNHQIEWASSAPLSSMANIRSFVSAARANARKIAFERCGLAIRYLPVGPEDITLQIAPNNQYYSDLAKKLTDEQKKAAFRVAGIHFHLGLKNAIHGINVHNRFVEIFDELVQRDNYGLPSERLSLYEKVVPNCRPQKIECLEHFYSMLTPKPTIEEMLQSYVGLIRPITKHGTCELRFFNATENLGHTMSLGGVVESVYRNV